MGDMGPQDGVGDAGSDVEQRTAGLSGNAGAGVGHGGGAVLHAAGDVSDLILAIVHGVQDGEDRIARDSEDIQDSLVNQVLNEILRGGLVIDHEPSSFVPRSRSRTV